MRFTTAALLLALTAVPASAGQKETETIDRTITIGASGELKLKNFSGDVRITGTSGTDVVVHAVRRAKREALDNIKLEITASGSSVSIEANKRDEGWREKNNNVVETNFDIKVPFGTQLDLYSFSGKLEVTGVQSRINAETFSGDVMLDVASAAQMPELSGETFSGDIRIVVGGRIRPRRVQQLQRQRGQRPADLDDHQPPAQRQRQHWERHRRHAQVQDLQRRSADSEVLTLQTPVSLAQGKQRAKTLVVFARFLLRRDVTRPVLVGLIQHPHRRQFLEVH